MTTSDTLLVGGGVALAAYLWWRSRKPKLTPVEIIRSYGRPPALKPTAGMKAVTLPGGPGAGAGKPLDTSTAVKPRRGVTTQPVDRVITV